MSSVITCTTPTIKYRFTVADPSTFTKAYLTIRQGSTVLIERDLSTATIDDMTVSWTLTQEETHQFDNTVTVQINWLTDGGVRGASEKTRLTISENSKDEVI